LVKKRRVYDEEPHSSFVFGFDNATNIHFGDVLNITPESIFSFDFSSFIATISPI
jgi:hypothetical protein